MKIFLPVPRSLTVFLMTVTLVLLTSTGGFAATKTWAGGAGATLNWTTGTWSPVGAPVAGDDIIFNTAGVLTFTTMPASIGFNSLTISQGTVTFTNGAAMVITIGSGAAVDLSVASGASLTLGNNTTITLLNNATTANITGTLAESGTGAFTTAAGSTVTYNGAAQNILGASFSNLTLGGTNTKTLVTSITVSGILTINAGVTLNIVGNTLGSPTSLVLESGTTASAIAGFGLITLGGDITVNYTGSGAIAATVAPPVTLGANRQFNVGAGAGLTMNGVISGIGFGLNKGGAGTITFTAANTYDGDFISSDGTTIVSNVSGLGPWQNLAMTQNRVSTLNGGTVVLATNTTVDPYTFFIGSDATLVSDRATAGAGVNHLLAGLTYSASTLTVNRGANATSGTPAVTFQNVRLFGGGVLNTGTADVVISGVVSGFDAPWKFTKTGAGTLTKTLSDWDLPGDFEINAGTYTPNGFNTTIAGNWINNGGTFTPGTSTITLRNLDPTAQTIGGSQPTIFNNLVIDNTAGVSLAANQTVNGSLTLTNGLLTIPSTNTLTIANANPILGGPFNTAKHIVTQVNTGTGAQGFLQVNNMTTALYAFPVGDATNYLPVSLTPSAACGFRVSSFSGITGNGAPNGTAFSGTRKSVCVDAVWTVNLVAGTPTVTMSTAWPASLEGAAFAAYTNPQVGIAHWDNPNWGVCAGSGDNTANTATRSAISVFSPFGVGKTGFVLPITISYFNASKGNSVNNLNWQANCSSSDVNFEVERSSDGRNFNTINTVTATAANCNQPFNYSDNTAPAGTVYYRLKATDITGKVYYSLIIKLSGQQKDIELVGISPNPVVGLAQLKLTVAKTDQVELTVINVDGKTVQRSSAKLQPGTSSINLDLGHLAPGLYLLKGVFTDGQTNSIRFIKQ